MTKENAKSQATIDAEKREVQDLINRILTNTKTVPPKVLSGSYQMAVGFKADAVKARAVASTSEPRLGSLRKAWQSLQRYYECQ